jgi:hypothetical protein
VNAYRELAERIQGELADLDTTIQKAIKSWNLAQKLGDSQDVYLDSVALNLHSFYSALEKLFELIVRHVDKVRLESTAWHRNLLDQVATDVAGVRPAVISIDIARELDQFRRFRHLVRNVYTFSLNAEKMISLMKALPQIWPKLSAELRAFSEFLNDLSEAST